jgi:hypothetical protein
MIRELLSMLRYRYIDPGFFLTRGHPLGFIYLCGPLPFADAVIYDKLLYFHIVDLYDTF